MHARRGREEEEAEEEGCENTGHARKEWNKRSDDEDDWR